MSEYEELQKIIHAQRRMMDEWKQICDDKNRILDEWISKYRHLAEEAGFLRQINSDLSKSIDKCDKMNAKK